MSFHRLNSQSTAKQLLAAGLATALSGFLPATAQTFDDIEDAVTQGSIFNDAAERAGPEVAQQEDASAIDGEAGVYVLRRNDIFSVSAIAGAGYSDNPARVQDSDIGGSASFQLALAAGVDTRVAQQYDAGANIVLSGTEYEESGAPDSRNAVANAYIGRGFFDGAFYGAISATYGQTMDGHFDNATAFYGVTANVTTVRRLSDRILVQPELSFSRQWSDLSEQENSNVTAGLTATWIPAQKWRVTGRVDYTYRIFDDFYEDVTFVERKDSVVRVTAGIQRQLSESISLSVSATYVDQESEFFLSEYTSFDGGVSARLVKRF